MKRLLAVVFLAAALYVAYLFFFKSTRHTSGPKPQAIKVQKHSKEFNQSISNAMFNYNNLKDAVTDADTSKIKSETQKFVTVLDSLKLDELKEDDSDIFITAKQQLSDIGANAQDIMLQTDLGEMREDFRMVSENVYPFLKTIGYEGNRLYWITCASAFGQDKEGSWVSNSTEIINPYWNPGHPQEKTCGEIKDSL
ncbi:MAG TPA: DUF3347 domain-containing protein [Chitinophagaceae bacterium]|nr:DUF3347 domain-containing protein [Chitinophagaceae bacterium]